MELMKVLSISAAALKAQGTRLRVIAENVANADSTGQGPNSEPYRRKVVAFGSELNRELGLELVTVDNITSDPSEFNRRYNPGHPAADENGYVLLPNVNALIELTDMREAQRSYEANLKVIQSSRIMLERTIDILR